MFDFFSTGIGIDISDHHIRMARVSGSGKVMGLFEILIPQGTVADERVEDPKGLQKQIARLCEKANVDLQKTSVTLLVPESRAFATVFDIPSPARGEDPLVAVLKSAQQTIPVPLTQVVFDVQEHRTKTGRSVTVFAVERTTFDSLMGGVFGEETKQKSLRAVEANSGALYRLFHRFETLPDVTFRDTSRLMLIDVGYRWTNISVYDHYARSLYSRSIALRHLSKKGDLQKKESLSESACIRIGVAAKEAMDFLHAEAHPIAAVLIAGVEGLEKEVRVQCEKTLKGLRVVCIGESVRIPGVPNKDIHTFGAAIGAALRAARPRVYNQANNFLRYLDIV